MAMFNGYVKVQKRVYLGNKHSQMLHGAGIFTYIWLIFGANVGKYSIHRAYGIHVSYCDYLEATHGLFMFIPLIFINHGVILHPGVTLPKIVG